MTTQLDVLKVARTVVIEALKRETMNNPYRRGLQDQLIRINAQIIAEQKKEDAQEEEL